MLPIYKIAGLCYNILYKSDKPDVCGIRKESIMRTLSLKARITVTVVIIMAATPVLTATISSVFMAVNSTKNITRAGLYTYLADAITRMPEMFAIYTGCPDELAVFSDGWEPDDD